VHVLKPKSNRKPQSAGVVREDRDTTSRDAAEASFIPILKKQGMHVPDRIEYDAAAGFAPHATGAPSAGKYEGNVARHRRENAPSGVASGLQKAPFGNLRSGRE